MNVVIKLIAYLCAVNNSVFRDNKYVALGLYFDPYAFSCKEALYFV